MFVCSPIAYMWHDIMVTIVENMNAMESLGNVEFNTDLYGSYIAFQVNDSDASQNVYARCVLCCSRVPQCDDHAVLVTGPQTLLLGELPSSLTARRTKDMASTVRLLQSSEQQLSNRNSY